MQTQDSFKVIGIKTRTQNDGSAAKDIPALWSKFMNDNIGQNVPNKVNNNIYCLYTNYAGNHLDPYDVVIGYRVKKVDEISKDLVVLDIPQQNVRSFLAKGSLHKGEAVVKKWFEIWEKDLDRAYAVDYEVYSEKSQDMDNAEVDIFISIN